MGQRWLVCMYKGYLEAYKENNATNIKYNLMCKLVELLLADNNEEVNKTTLECIAQLLQVSGSSRVGPFYF